MLRLLRRAVPFLTVALLAALAYDGWIFYSRWQERRAGERQLAEKEAEDARKTIDLLGGGQLKILNFYSNPGTLHRGAEANVCYGVYGAKKVRVEPPVAELYPAIAHCFQVSPAKDTVYKLIAEDDKGHTASEQFTIKVVP